MVRILALLTGAILVGIQCTQREFTNPDDPESPTFNHAPQFITTDVDLTDTLYVGQLWTDSLEVDDVDGDLLTYNLLISPSEEFKLTGNILSWNPANLAVGNHEISIQVSDGNEGRDTLLWKITVVIPEIPVPKGFTTESVSMDSIKLVWQDNSDFETGFFLTWTNGHQSYSDSLPPNKESFTITEGLLPNRTYSITIKGLSSTSKSEENRLTVTTPQNLTKKARYVSVKNGIISFARSTGSNHFDSLYLSIPLANPLKDNDELYLWSYSPLFPRSDRSPRLEGKLVRRSDSVSYFSLVAPPAQSWFQSWNGKWKSEYVVSVEGSFPPDSLPTTQLYAVDIDTAWQIAFSEILERAPLSLNEAGKSLNQAVNDNMGFIFQHVNLIASGYLNHTKHVHNMFMGQSHALAAYASAGTPSGDKNGPITYFPAIKQRVEVMRDFSPPSSDQRTKANTAIEILDSLNILASEAVEWAEVIIEQPNGQGGADSVNQEQLLPRVLLIKTSDPSQPSPLSGFIYGVEQFDDLISDLAIFVLKATP